MFVELHILQNFAPACLNRDDTNTPKDCTFGGHRRARISSQCVKRSVRKHFAEENLVSEEHRAERSKRLIGEVARLVRAANPAADQADAAVTKALAAVRLATDAKNPKETQYLLFLGNEEMRRLAEVVASNYEALKPAAEPAAEAGEGKAKKTAKQRKSEDQKGVGDELAKAVKRVFNGGKAVDLALFGRMLADQADLNVDAACQVAHALSTNKVDMELDFYTAVDDLKARSDDAEDAGAGMIGTSEFNSACFYRYSNVHVGQLTKNLQGDGELTRLAVDAYVRASVTSVPTGKQNSTAAQSPPSFVLAVVRTAGLWSLANAFEKPVDGRADGKNGFGLVGNSVAALDAYWAKLTAAYGAGQVTAAAAFKLTDRVELAALKGYEVAGLDPLVAAVTAALAPALPAGGAA